jgi:putative CocE/NonD family hydrolase
MTHDISEEARFRPLRNFSITRHLSFPDREIAPYFYDWMEHPSYDNYWAQWNIDLLYPEISIPCLNIAGWYDCFQTGAIRNFCGVSAQGQTSEVKAAQRLFVGPYGHASPTHGCHHPVTMLREMDPGPGALVDFTDLCLRWFDYWLKGIENGAVRYFTFGSNQWEAATSWPVKGTRFISYYLHSRGQANGLGGDGTLSLKEPGVEDPDRFVYDPDNPVPTIGGSLCCADEFVVPRGPHDQREVEKRPDVLVYSSNPLKEDLQVTGAVEMILHAASTALDTDFTVKLIDVFPSGYARNLTDGILRARYRSSMSAAQLMEPNSIYEFRIQAGSVSNIFRKGHSIRLEISSSNFPRFDRNPNTGRTIAEESESIKARNTIFHDQQRPSCLILPVISSEES